MKENLSFSQFYEAVNDAWFFISETCVDVSKEHISAEEAIRKIRGLLKPLDRYLGSTSSFAPIADLSEYSDKLWKAAYERGKAEALSEVVRCKDCVHWTPWLNRTPLVNKCHCDIHFNLGHEDFYCADGRRKDAEIH